MYTPNFNDPRVMNRIRHAYGFAVGALSQKPQNWSTRYIDKYFGHQGNNLSKWLRQKLLIVTNNHYSMDSGLTKEYVLNVQGTDYIRNILRGVVQDDFVSSFEGSGLIEQQNNRFDNEIVHKFLCKEFGHELATKQFSYTDKSNRYWHPLQNIRNQQRVKFFAQYNFNYQYDIVASAPNLIHQHSQQIPYICDNLGKYLQGPMDLYLFALCRYLNDRHSVRNELANNLQVDIKTAKVIINSLFSGARIGHGDDYAISRLLNNDLSKIEYLKQDQYINELKDNIKTCWDYIKPTMTRIGITDKNNKHRLLPISSKQKWIRYFDLERQVMNQVIKYLNLTNNNYFLEHDGWSCTDIIDTNELSNFVFANTNFRTEFEQKITLPNWKYKQNLLDLIN